MSSANQPHRLSWLGGKEEQHVSSEIQIWGPSGWASQRGDVWDEHMGSICVLFGLCSIE